MTDNITISAFGALNNGSYEMFAELIQHFADKKELHVEVRCAGPYPNAEAVTVSGRPLRGDALKDPELKEELFKAVAEDALSLGDVDVYCMPCMSMIGFHDGVEEKLEKPIVRLAEALKDFYKDVDKLGVIHMRPAKNRVAEIFGSKAVTPNEEQAEKLLKAEAATKQTLDEGPIEEVMEEIVKSFRDQGISHILFARADAPKAQNSPAGQVSGVQINSYFDILARYILETVT